MTPNPDPRWENIIGGISPSGIVRPMSFEVLEELAAEWKSLAPNVAEDGGAGSLLRTARSLFAHAWFDYEFMVVAALVAFQGLEVVFRELYPDSPKTPLRKLIRRAVSEGVVPSAIGDVADSGAELRNLLSHPQMQAAFSIGMAGGMIEQTHRIVAMVSAATAERAE